MKKIIGIESAPRQHWVGDGFPVRSLFSYHDHGDSLDPFLLLDRAGPMDFTPTGQSGVIGPGDVQWMTAASGILHEEFHSEAFSREGGTLDMVQLWVNLPAKDKMSPPRYQAITYDSIPAVSLPGGASVTLPAEEGWNTAVIVLRGTVTVNDEAIVGEAQMAVLDRAGSGLALKGDSDAMLLLLSGEPIGEPVVGYGPFVMNSQEQILQAIADFNNGRF